MKKLGYLLVIVLLLAIAAYAARKPLLQRIVTFKIDQTLQRVDTSLLDDGQLHVILCGTAAALPDVDRAGPCTAVIAGGQFWLVDVGPGSWSNVDTLNLPISKLSGILFTHFHSDHIGDLGEAITQSWLAGRTQPLDIYGPPGVDQVVAGFAQAYALDQGYRVAHHGAEYVPPAGDSAVAHALPLPQGTAALPVFERDGLRVSAFLVHHEPASPAFGYRFEYRGRVVVISGDTRKTESVIVNAENADLLIHEALDADMLHRASAEARKLGMNRLAKLANDLPGYHTTPVQAAEVAAAAHVHKLVLTHIFPPLPNTLARRMFLSGTAAAFHGPIVLGADGMRFDLEPKTGAGT
ncbi:MAG: MBL fold metallo-hydrolase [Stenotrophobium sp.]